MAAGSIVIDLMMRTGSFETDTKRAEKSLKELEKTAIEAGKVIGTAFTAVAAATALLVKSQIDAADEMGKAASKAGVTTESLSALAYAAELSGSSQDEMTAALARLSKQMVDAASGSTEAQNAFAAIGVSVLDASGNIKQADAVFLEIAARFASMPDGVLKTNAAIEIFGKSGAALIPTLNSGADGLAALAAEAEKLGIIISGDTALAAAEFNDNITRLQKSVGGLGLTIANQVLPTMTGLTQEMLNFNNGSSIAEIAGKGFVVVLQTVAVLAANVAYVLRTIGNEIGGIAAQLGALARLDFKAFRFIGEEMKRDAVQARAEIDALEARIMRASGTPASATPSVAPAKTFIPKIIPKATSTPKPAEFRDPLADSARLYASTLEAINRAQIDASISGQELTSTQKKLVDLMSDQAFLDMPDAWKEVIYQQAASAIAAEKVTLQIDEMNKKQARLNELLGVTALEKQRADMLLLADAFETGKISAEEYESAVKRALDIPSIDPEETRLKELLGTAEWEKQLADLTLLSDAFEAGKIRADEYAAAVQRVMKNASDGAKETDDFAKSLGMTFSSAFEDAIVSGKKLSDVLKGLAQDILRIMTRKIITEPLGNAFSSMITSAFGGFRAAGGPVMANTSYVVGERGPELFTPSSAGTITPNDSLAGGGARVQINVQNNAGSETRASAKAREDGSGTTIIDIMVERVESTISKRISQGSGMAPLLERRYGLNPAVGAMR